MLMIPSTMDRFRAASDLFQRDTTELWEDGVPLDDRRYSEIAVRAISGLVPELLDPRLRAARATIDGDLAVVSQSDDVVNPYVAYREAHVEGMLPAEGLVTIEQITFGENPDEEFTGIDLCLNVDPRFADPDPVDLIFGEKLYMPFSSMRDAQPI